MTSLLAELPPSERGRARPAGRAHFYRPMLATLTDRYFSSPDWIYERKLDGERVIAVRSGASVHLFSRNEQRLDGAYPEVVDALTRQQADDFVVDGEVVAFEGRSTSFARLQGRMQTRDPDRARRSGIEVFFYVFDLPHLERHDVTALALRTRKRLLRRLLEYREPLRFTPHRNGEGERYYAEACRKGWEGVIAKRADSRYVAGRSTNWLKFKCVNSQELVIGGYTEPRGSRSGFGAILVGYFDGGRLRYAGKVGTGFDSTTLRDLGERMHGLERDESPFTGTVPSRGVHWVEPELVGEVGFTEWTGDGRLRHPRFLGLRRDKQARDVVRERPR